MKTTTTQYWCIAAGAHGKLHAPPHSTGSVLEIRAYGLPNLAEHLALANANSEFSDIEVVVGGTTFYGCNVHRPGGGRYCYFN